MIVSLEMIHAPTGRLVTAMTIWPLLFIWSSARFTGTGIVFVTGVTRAGRMNADITNSLVSVYRGVLLYGDSGSGKSSLVNAGLIPEAIRLGFAPEQLRVQPRASEELVIERVRSAADDEEELLPSFLALDEESSAGTVLAGRRLRGTRPRGVRAASVAADLRPVRGDRDPVRRGRGP